MRTPLEPKRGPAMTPWEKVLAVLAIALIVGSIVVAFVAGYGWTHDPVMRERKPHAGSVGH